MVAGGFRGFQRAFSLLKSFAGGECGGRVSSEKFQGCLRGFQRLREIQESFRKASEAFQGVPEW